jgi:hypothetical protein
VSTTARSFDTDERPWNIVSDRRGHRCSISRPRPPRLGERIICADCHTEYLMVDTPFGREWRPQTPADRGVERIVRHRGTTGPRQQ